MGTSPLHPNFNGKKNPRELIGFDIFSILKYGIEIGN
jgi:hypothetical protein